MAPNPKTAGSHPRKSEPVRYTPSLAIEGAWLFDLGIVSTEVYLSPRPKPKTLDSTDSQPQPPNPDS